MQQQETQTGGPCSQPVIPPVSTTRFATARPPIREQPVAPPRRKALLPPGYKPPIPKKPILPPKKIPPVPPPRPPRLMLPPNSPKDSPVYAQESVPAIPEVHSQNEDATYPPGSRPTRTKAVRKGTEGLDVQVGPDAFFQSDKVMSLNIFNFDKFIKQNEKTLILFFDSLKHDSVYLSREFADAANKSQNRNHAFAAVNCSVDSDLCCRERITKTPMMKLFSNGFPISTMEFLEGFDASRLITLLIMTPVLKHPRTEVKK